MEQQFVEEQEAPETGQVAWYCLRTQVKREHIASRMLRSRVDLEVFAPRITYTKKTKRGKVRFTEALFPGYIFTRCDIQQHLRHIRAIEGVQGAVRYGNLIPKIPEAFIAELRSRIPEENHESPDPVIEVGAPVVVVDGPFKDLHAVVTRILTPRERVRILLEFLGRQAEIEISAAALLPDNHNPKEGF